MTDFLDLHGATNRSVRALADAMLQRHGLYLGEDHLLAALWETEGQTPRELARGAHVSTSGIVKMVNRMVAASLIVRVRDDRDCRLVRLRLTDARRELQQPVEHGRGALEAKLFALLTGPKRHSCLCFWERYTIPRPLCGGTDEADRLV